uniref:SprT-like domain-containing protein n=1 Tax=Xenopus tropicalis TaxID=8364 RepID=A0A6I8RYP6_XENTR
MGKQTTQINVLGLRLTGIYIKCSNPAIEQLSVVDPYWEVLDPKPDIHALFDDFNKRFFRGQLPPIDLKWSNRLCITAGICIQDNISGKCRIRLNKPLLDLRPRKNTVETLLHEMIHYYQRLRGTSDIDHGATFHFHMERINRESGANITVYHDFDREYESLKRHWWKCNGPCAQVVKRLADRTPGSKAHKRKCGGEFIKNHFRNILETFSLLITVLPGNKAVAQECPGLSYGK